MFIDDMNNIDAGHDNASESFSNILNSTAQHIFIFAVLHSFHLIECRNLVNDSSYFAV